MTWARSNNAEANGGMIQNPLSGLIVYRGIMNQFSHFCVSYKARKLAALAQALITLGSPSAPTRLRDLSTLSTVTRNNLVSFQATIFNPTSKRLQCFLPSQ